MRNNFSNLSTKEQNRLLGLRELETIYDNHFVEEFKDGCMLLVNQFIQSLEEPPTKKQKEAVAKINSFFEYIE